MRTSTILLTTVLVAVAFAGCAEDTGGGGGEDDGTNPGGGTTRYVVGTEAAFPPFEDVDANGDFVGYDMDVIREIARRNGWELDIRNLGFDTLIPSLQNGQIDIAISAMSITEERSQTVDFSISYYEANQSIAMRADDDRAFASLDDLRGQGLVFGAQGATTAVDIIEAEFVSQEDGTLRRYDSYPLALQALKNGDVDVVMMDAPAQRQAAETDAAIVVAFEFSTGDRYGIAVAKGNAELLNDINDALEAMHDDGTLQQLRDEWEI